MKDIRCSLSYQNGLENTALSLGNSLDTFEKEIRFSFKRYGRYKKLVRRKK